MKLEDAMKLRPGDLVTVTLGTGEKIRGELLSIVDEPCVIIERGGTFPTAVALSHIEAAE